MLDFIRGVVRPTLTWIGFIALTILVFLGKLDAREYLPLVAGMVGYWFGQRTSNGNPPA